MKIYLFDWKDLTHASQNGYLPLIWKLCSKMPLFFYLKIYIEFDFEDIKFYTELDFVKIEFLNKGILLKPQNIGILLHSFQIRDKYPFSPT